jgi:hypothetical protein
MKEISLNGTQITATFDVAEIINELNESQIIDLLDSIATHDKVIEFVARQICFGATESGSWGDWRCLAEAREMIIGNIPELKELQLEAIATAKRDAFRDGVRRGMRKVVGYDGWTPRIEGEMRELFDKGPA